MAGHPLATSASDPDALPLLPKRTAVPNGAAGRKNPTPTKSQSVKELKWHERLWRQRTPFHHFGRAMKEKHDKLNENTTEAREELAKRGGKLRYHCTDLYDGQVLMFWTRILSNDAGVAASWTCEVPPAAKFTRSPFARTGALIPFLSRLNPGRWTGFGAPLSTKAIDDVKGIAKPFLRAYNMFQQDRARKEAEGRKGKIKCHQYRLIGIPLVIRRDTGGASFYQSERGIEFGQHNLKTVPRVAPTKFVDKLLNEISQEAHGKASLEKKMERFYSTAAPSKTGAAMQGAGYLQESHIVVIDQISVDLPRRRR